jgi:hypothetical protein
MILIDFSIFFEIIFIEINIFFSANEEFQYMFKKNFNTCLKSEIDAKKEENVFLICLSLKNEKIRRKPEY